MKTKENKKELSSDEIIEIISKYSLSVRCLPKEVVTYLTYHEGDENKEFSDPFGSLEVVIKDVIPEDCNLSYFRKNIPNFNRLTHKQKFDEWKKFNPSPQKVLKETHKLEKGGYWFVKEVPNTYSTVRFERNNDFFAPTLIEAIMLFLESKK